MEPKNSSNSKFQTEHDEIKNDLVRLSKNDQSSLLIEKSEIKSLKSKISQVSREYKTKQKPLLEFTKDELLRLPTVPVVDDDKSGEEEETEEEEEEKLETDTLPLWVDKSFDTFLWTVPFTTVFICLDVAIHSQYGQEVTLESEYKRLINVTPSLILLIHFTLHHSSHLFTRLTLFSLSAIGGSYMVHIMNKFSYLLVMKQTPALGTLWIYSVVRMELREAVISLCIVAGWCWYNKLSLMV
ncbi:hypothetical protein CROQUDRAFT_61480 [Cronartium quercuum f. sp. fusiforme G11]|uniref:DUF7719 domain-containing protein n=1 Tax=Cronartium quercuum f. sp. fusiforme G11 TaxID=708437 RepID=A0A9P6NKJ8_9BASI|nr:hypothetical protein CROQUDRAFT_61480 [Cronartium quercuum f. sp. fusiforme G11]